MKKIYISIGLGFALTVVAFALVIGNLKSEVETLRENVSVNLQTEQERNRLLKEKDDQLIDILNRNSAQISLLDESISPADKRWVLIKKVRKAMTDTIKQNGYRQVPDINGLTTISAAIVDSSDKFDVPISLVLGVMTQESAFNPNAISRAGAQGLMQLMPDTAKECANDINKPFYNVFKMKDNVELGTWYLWKMLDIFKGDVELAIRAYNTGPTNVRRVIAGELQDYYSETIDYHQKVMQWKSQYEIMGL